MLKVVWQLVTNFFSSIYWTNHMTFTTGRANDNSAYLSKKISRALQLKKYKKTHVRWLNYVLRKKNTYGEILVKRSSCCVKSSQRTVKRVKFPYVDMSSIRKQLEMIYHLIWKFYAKKSLDKKSYDEFFLPIIQVKKIKKSNNNCNSLMQNIKVIFQ